MSHLLADHAGAWARRAHLFPSLKYNKDGIVYSMDKPQPTFEVVFYNRRVADWASELPQGIRASFRRIVEMVEIFGLHVDMPHVRPMGDGLYEIRAKGREGIARAFHCQVSGNRIIILHGFVKKTEKTPHHELEIARRRRREVK